MPGFSTRPDRLPRWRAISLRLAIVIVAGAALALAWFAGVVREHRLVREMILANDGVYFYEYEPQTVTRYTRTTWVPAWLRSIIGEDFFHDVTFVRIEGARFGDSELGRMEILDRIESLGVVESGITDAGLVHLRGRRALKGLFLSGNWIGDDGIDNLGLETLPQLEVIDISQTLVSAGKEAEIRRRFPKLVIIDNGRSYRLVAPGEGRGDRLRADVGGSVPRRELPPRRDRRRWAMRAGRRGWVISRGLSTRPVGNMAMRPGASPANASHSARVPTASGRQDPDLNSEDAMPITPQFARREFLRQAALIVALGLVGPRAETLRAQEAPARPAPEAEGGPHARAVEGRVLDPDGKPVAGATVVIGLQDTGKPNHEVLRSDEAGRFAWPIPPGKAMAYVVAHKDGFAAATWQRYFPPEAGGDGVQLTLGRSEPFSGVLADGEGRPVAGARVRVEMIAHGSVELNPGGGSSISIGWSYFPREVIDGSPLLRLFETTADGEGAFTFRESSRDGWLKLGVTTRDGKQYRVKAESPGVGPLARSMDETGFVGAPAGGVARLVAVPAARVEGVVVTEPERLGIEGLKVWYQGCRPTADGRFRGGRVHEANFGGSTLTTEGGRFVFDGLDEGAINIIVTGPGEGVDWTYRAAADVALVPGETAKVEIELIRGVEVEGTVVDAGSGEPIEGAMVGMHGRSRPRSGAGSGAATTDRQGRYRFRLPPGETYFYIMGGVDIPPGTGPSRTITIPEDAETFTVPPLEVKGLKPTPR